jgi:hypothetical protein
VSTFNRVSARVQSRVSLMLGVFLRSSLRIACTAGHDLVGQTLGDARHLEENDGPLLLAIREVDVEVQAATLQGVGHLTGVVAGEHDQRDVLGLQGAELRHAHLEVREHFQQEGLELGVGFVDLVDQEHRRARRRDRLQERPRDDEALREEDVVWAGDALDGLFQARRSGDDLADLVLEDLGVEQLLGVLPLVERLRLVEALRSTAGG